MDSKLQFSADDVFTMAIKVQQHAAEFYRRLAIHYKKTNIKEALQRLSMEKEKHEQTMAVMRTELKKLGGQESLPTNETLSGFTELFLNGEIFNENVFREAIGLTGAEDVLLKAVQLQINTIGFFLCVRDLVPDYLGKSRVRDIIIEEMHHMSSLESLLGDAGN